MPDKENQMEPQTETHGDERQIAEVEVKVEPVVEPAPETPKENDLPEGCVKAY